MISIVTRYRKHDCTLAALAIARHFEDMTRRYALISYDWRTGFVDPAYDNKVRHTAFQRLLTKTKHFVWTAPVDNYFIETAQKHGIRSTLYTSWDQLEPYDEKVIGEYTHVLVPSLVQAMQLRDRFKLRNVAVLPYDGGLPHTIKSTFCDSRIRLYLSLYGAQLHRVDFSAIILLSHLVRDMPNVHVTIGCCKGLAQYTKREIKLLAKMYPDRWRVLWNCSWPQQAIEMGQHDLTIWPARWDGLGLVGITSLTMGTPVIAWDVTPMNEYLSAGRNSILVPVPVQYNWIGMPVAQPDYTEFDRILRWLITQPDMLTELKQHTNEQLPGRREDFQKGWNAILPMAL
jgi:glycosyltransferase involved in cell wall biosynthesis